MADLDGLTEEVLARCDALGAISDDPTCLTRTFLGPATWRVHELLGEWMREAGLTVRRDAIGNLIGRRTGRIDSVFAIGSHIDTVPNAGKYDGVLGVILGVAAMQTLAGRTFARSVDVIAFSEEEGVRFQTPFLGSRAVCDRFDSRWLDLTDASEVTLAHTVRDFGLEPSGIPAAAYPAGQLVGFFEPHIEQGPVLESLNAPLGVVTAIVGQSRYSLQLTGHAGHAGTLPMELRRDALVAAAELVGIVERTARSTIGLRATVGTLVIAPCAVNVVPGDVKLSLDVRHESDVVRRQAVEQVFRQAKEIAAERQLVLRIEPLLEESAVACDREMSDRLAMAGNITHWLVSGAGHDAAVMATRCPVSMLFIRSPGGISHHPDEAVRREDVRAALEVMIRFLSIELDRE